MRGRLVILLVLGLLIAGCSPIQGKDLGREGGGRNLGGPGGLTFISRQNLSMEVWEARAGPWSWTNNALRDIAVGVWSQTPVST